MNPDLPGFSGRASAQETTGDEKSQVVLKQPREKRVPGAHRRRCRVPSVPQMQAVTEAVESGAEVAAAVEG